MKFRWTESEKERFYKRAEKQLKEAGIDFISVDRTQFGIRGYNAEKGTVEAVVISLTPYPYRHFSNVRKGALKRLGNWECTDAKRERKIISEEEQIFMHSRLIIKETRGRKKEK